MATTLSPERGKELVERVWQVRKREPAAFGDVLMENNGYSVTVGTLAAPQTILAWFEKAGLLVTQIETGSQPVMVWFREAAT